MTTPSTDDLRAFGIELFDRWTALWNGDLALASKIMASDFVLRYAQAGTEMVDQVRSPQALADLIRDWRAARPGLRFSVEGDAVIDLERSEGGLPSGRIARPYLAVVVKEGETIARSGIDLFAVSRGLITEVWSVSSGVAGRTFYARPGVDR